MSNHVRPSLPFFASFDLRGLGLLPEGWELELKLLAKREGRSLRLEPGQPPRPDKGTEPIGFDLVAGECVRRAAPWLYDLYLGPLLGLVQGIVAQQVVAAEQVESSVNVNLIPCGMLGYPVHADSNSVTGLLFATSHKRTEGGILVFESDEARLEITTNAGRFHVFGAKNWPHYVTRATNSDRIAVVMTYHYAGEPQQRPADVDEFLYE